ncbi:translation initiation factor Sui1 [Solidesulfovibrio sp.]
MPPRPDTRSTRVYSTDHGRLCPGCGHPADRCACSRAKSVPTGDGIVRIARQTKGRKGKGVCLVTGLPLPPEALEALARELKQRCGCGGTVKDGVIEIQGDNRELLAGELGKRGYVVRLAGG